MPPLIIQHASMYLLKQLLASPLTIGRISPSATPERNHLFLSEQDQCKKSII